MKITQTASAGTLESNDVLITISPGTGITMELESIVINQFGMQIKKTVSESLSECGVSDAHVYIQDKGAIDCVIKARCEAAISRAGGKE